MMLFILVCAIFIFAVAMFGVAGLAVFSVAEIIASCEELDESPRDKDDDFVVRVGCALESMLKMPYSHVSASIGRNVH